MNMKYTPTYSRTLLPVWNNVTPDTILHFNERLPHYFLWLESSIVRSVSINEINSF